MSKETQVAVFQAADEQLSVQLGLSKDTMLTTMKAQCFRQIPPEKVSNAMLVTFVQIAKALTLNPLLPGMLYAYPDRNSGGITPMIGPDGVYTMLANNPDIVGNENGPAWWCEHSKDDEGRWTCTAFINHRGKGTLKKQIWIDEWIVDSNPNWKTRPRHMAEIRALKHCARQIIHGIPMDEDERTIAEARQLNEIPTDRPKKPAGVEAMRAEVVVEAGATGVDLQPNEVVVEPPEEKRKPGRPRKPQQEEKPAESPQPEPAPVEQAKVPKEPEPVVDRQNVVTLSGEITETILRDTNSAQYPKVRSFNLKTDDGPQSLFWDPAVPENPLVAKVGNHITVNAELRHSRNPQKPPSMFAFEASEVAKNAEVDDLDFGQPAN